MKHLLFIGGHDSGKSTLIRGLSGCSTRGFQGFIHDRVRHRSVYVVSSSPQESGISEEDYRAAMTEASSDKECRVVMTAIQPNKPYSRLSLEDCIRISQEFDNVEISAYVIAHPHDEKAHIPSDAELTEVRGRLREAGVFSIITVDNRLLLGENVAKILGTLL